METVDTFAKLYFSIEGRDDFETTLAENVGARKLHEAYVIGMGLLDGVGTQVTLRRYIQRFDLSRWQNMIQSSKIGFHSQLNPNMVPNFGLFGNL